MSEQKKTNPNKETQAFPTYKGKPLVRSGDTIYYGSMADKYVVKLDIKSKKTVGALEVADKVSVQLQLTDPDLKSRDRVVEKERPRPYLFPPVDMGSIWLMRALAGK